MLNAIIRFAINNKLIVGLFTIALILYGSYEVTRLPIDAVPDITDNQVQVITIAPSFGATDIERLVTFPIEQANNNIQGLKEIRSFSRFGLSLVTIVFDDATDIYWARQQVTERLQQVAPNIPQGIGTPELGPISTGLGEIYQYVVRPEKGFEDQYDETELRTIQDWIVRRQLLSVKGVAEVSSFGGKLKQYAIEVDPNKLQSFSITINDVFDALAQNNQNTGGAYIEKTKTALFIRSEGLIGNFDDINNIAVKHLDDGTPVLMKDVATVKIGYATRYGAMCYNDKGEVSGAVVMMLKGANSSEVIKNVKERIAQIQKTLPKGVVIEAFLDRTKMVNNAIGTVEKNLLEGALIVIFVLVLFLGNLRAGLLVASVIPLSMLFAIIMMNLFGVSGNLMSLGALDFGLIVDGAVIIVEAVMHRLSHSKHFAQVDRLSRQEMDAEVQSYAGKMMNSAVFGQIIILIVYLPIFALQGIEGKMFKPMAQTVSFALIGAFILSLTYVPMMSAWVLSRKIKHTPNYADRLMGKLERFYQHLLEKVLAFKKAVIVTTLALFAVAVLVLTQLGGEFIPALEEGDFAVDTRVLTGSSLTTTIEHTQKAAKILKDRFPEVEKVVTKIGSGEVPTDPMPMEASDMMVILKDKKYWTSASSFNELSEKMGEAIAEVPGITAGFQFPVQMRFNELMTGARQDVVCKIFGEDLDTLAAYAHKLGTIVNTVNGARNLYVEPIGGIPQIVIRYKRNMIAQYGLDIATINKVVNTAFAGQVAGMVNEGEKRFDLVVRLSGELKKDVTDVQQLLVPAKKSQVPLYMLADVVLTEGPNQVQREDAKRRIVVGFNVRGRDVETIVKELQQKVDQQIKLPPGYYVTYGGAFENLKAAKDRLMIAVPVSLLLIFLLLYFAFGSIKLGLLIYSAIPLSAIGGILSLAARGLPFSISAGVGFIALFGVAVLNGIVLIAEFKRLRSEGMNDIRRVILMGTKVRLRPVLMTALVASLGFLPMALSNGAGAEVQRPLATVVIGGLLTATFLTLFVLPVLYNLFENNPGNMKKKKKKGMNAAALLLLLLCTAWMNPLAAQQKISLTAAQDSALTRNLQLAHEKMRVDYAASLIKTATVVPNTSFLAEAGQMNSIYTDTRVTVSQGFYLPKVNASQRAVYRSEWEGSRISNELKQAYIKREVAVWYYQLAYLWGRKKMLLYADSLYKVWYQKVQLRLAKGETNILEKTAAETQLGQVNNLLQQNETEIANAQLQLGYLMNSDVKYVPAEESTAINTVVAFDTTILMQHPYIKHAIQQSNIAAANIQLAKAKLLPEISVGYSNTSIRGVGADEQFYSGGRRFSAVAAGISVPIFANAQKAKVNSARINYSMSVQLNNAEAMAFQKMYRETYLRYQKEMQTLQYFDKTALNNAAVIITTADKQLGSGAINYIEWMQLVGQALNVRYEYQDALRAVNITVAELHYFMNK